MTFFCLCFLLFVIIIFLSIFVFKKQQRKALLFLKIPMVVRFFHYVTVLSHIFLLFLIDFFWTLIYIGYFNIFQDLFFYQSPSRNLFYQIIKTRKCDAKGCSKMLCSNCVCLPFPSLRLEILAAGIL